MRCRWHGSESKGRVSCGTDVATVPRPAACERRGGCALSTFYGEDLAYIHDAGFTDLSRHAGLQVLAALAAGGIHGGLIVDLGCGSGTWAAMASAAGYGFLGIDVSEEMLRRARSAAPSAEFRLASLYSAEIPGCVAVTAFGEVLNYGTPAPPAPGMLESLIRRVSSALADGGLLVFDLLVGSDGPPMSYRSWRSASDFAVLVDVEEQADERILLRDITLFRKVDDLYRRTREQHLLSVFDAGSVQFFLSSAGFAVECATHYGDYRVGDRRTVYFARKRAAGAGALDR